MNLKHLMLLVVALCASNAIVNAEQKTACIKDEKSCKNCKYCYCAFAKEGQGGLRKREAADKPVFIKNDELKHYCYCQKRDRKEALRKAKALEDEAAE